MRVLVIASRPTDSARGDLAPVGLVLRALTEHGHEVHAVCDAADPMRSFESLTVWPVHASRSHGTPAMTSRALAAGRSIAPDVILAEERCLASGSLVAKRCGGSLVPMFVGVHGPRRAGRLLGPIETRAVRQAPLCIGFGPYQTDAALRRGAKRTLELPGVARIPPVPRTASGWLRRHLGLDHGVLAVAWGDLSPEDGTDILIEGVKVAADADHDLHAAIFGGDEATIDRYEAKAERLGVHDRVHLLGGWHASKLDALLPEADIVIEPSIVPHRTPPALYTLLAAHRPMILAQAAGRSRLVGPKACVIAPADRLGIGHALSQLAANESARLHYAEAGRQFVAAHHTYDVFASTLACLEDRVRVGPGSDPSAASDQTEETGSPASIGA
ncbi:MAG: glycosyltransferase [Planctomycetota bacterium]